MLPKTHAILGIISSILIYFIFKITFFEAFLIFFASVFTDFDHYTWYVLKKKDFSLKNAYIFQKKEMHIKHKPIMHIFHTIEFLILILILSYFFNLLWFLLIGMLFHSFLDIIDMQYRGILNLREYSLTRYIMSDKKNYY